jgi:hypothetical protein
LNAAISFSKSIETGRKGGTLETVGISSQVDGNWQPKWRHVDEKKKQFFFSLVDKIHNRQSYTRKHEVCTEHLLCSVLFVGKDRPNLRADSRCPLSSNREKSKSLGLPPLIFISTET